MSNFAQPASAGGDNFDIKEHIGHLAIIYPKNFDPAVKTKASNDPTAMADCDIILVDKYGPDGKPLAFHDARIFGNLARSVRNDVGGQVLGRLGQGEPSPGRTAPWILTNFSDQDAAMADPIDQAYRQGHFAPTPNPMQAPAQQYGAPPVSAPTPPPQWQPQAPAPQQAWAGAVAPPSPTPAPTAPTPQWQPPQQAAPPASAVAAPAVIDPGLIAFLASRGINGPFPDQATAEAIAATLPQ